MYVALAVDIVSRRDSPTSNPLSYATQVKVDHIYIGLHVPRPTDFSIVKLYAVDCHVRLRAARAVCFESRCSSYSSS